MPQGCDSVISAKLGQKYARRKAFAVLLRSGYTEVWSLRKWHSVCLTFNSSDNLIKIFLDGSFKTSEFYTKNDFKSGNIILFQKSNNEHNDQHGGENSISYQAQTEITDLNIWNTSMSTTLMESWSNCESELYGNYLKWSSIEFGDDIQSYSQDINKICSQPENFIVHQDTKNFADTQNFCRNMGGTMAVAKDNQTLKQMTELFKSPDGSKLDDCEDGFFIGYSDEQEEGSWVSIEDGTSITDDHKWANENPTNNLIFNQAVYTDGKIFDRWEQNSYCPICSMQNQRLFELDNICPEDHNIDKFYAMVNTSYFVGLVATRLYKNAFEVWVIETTDDSSLLANLSVPVGQDPDEFIPSGLHSWQYSKLECNTDFIKINQNGKDQDVPVRQMNLHLSVDRPGNFCCSDGTCINSKLVCDGNHDCSDDEYDYNDRIEMTQMRDTEASQKTDVLVNVSIMELLEVSQEKSTFTVFFWIKLEWKNSKLAFKFLHDNFQLNNVNTMTNLSIWIPKLRYYHIYDDQMITLKSTNYIKRGLSQNSSLSSNQLRPTELYEGSENTFMMDVLHRYQFFKRKFLD